MYLLSALALARVFLLWPLTVLTRQTRQAVHAIYQYNFNMMSMNTIAFLCLACYLMKMSIGRNHNKLEP